MKPTERNGRKMLTVDQAADRLGLSPATIRAWVWRRKIEHTRLGRAVRISEAVIDRMVERGTVPAIESPS
jgi:excisionase family DNA binding protein